MPYSISARPILGIIVLVLAIAITRHSASAQVCNGGAPFSNGLVRLGATFGGSTGADHVIREGGAGLGAQLALGAAQGFFANVSGSIVLYSDPTRFSREGLAARRSDDAGALIASATGGYAIPVATSGKVVFCPIVGLSRQSGPQLWAECRPEGGGTTCSGSIDGRGSAFWSGGTIGGLVRSSPTFSFVPFAGVAYVRSTITAQGSGGSGSATVDYVAITAGAGVVLKRLTVRPVISFPVRLEGGKRTQGLEISFSVGPKRAQQELPGRHSDRAAEAQVR